MGKYLFLLRSGIAALYINKIYICETCRTYFYNVDRYYNQVSRINQLLTKIIAIDTSSMIWNVQYSPSRDFHYLTWHSKESISMSFKATILSETSFERSWCNWVRNKSLQPDFWYMQSLGYYIYIYIYIDSYI